MKLILAIVGLLFSLSLSAQSFSDTKICELIQEYKDDPRGPYRDIRWFCSNGEINMPREPCEDDPDAVQHARMKWSVEAIAANRHVFLSQILTGTEKWRFWDASNDHSRLKQYHLAKYLEAADNGWVLKTGQFYRGALQVEDEREWGKDFLRWSVGDKNRLNSNFFLLRQAAKIIPHSEETEQSFSVRAISKNISDVYPKFQDLRIKIHGQPAVSDLPQVREFYKENKAALSNDLQQQFTTLIADMEEMYQPANLENLRPFIKSLPNNSTIKQQLNDFVAYHANSSNKTAQLLATAEMLWTIRDQITSFGSQRGRLALLDISNELEEMYFKEINAWETPKTADLMEKICYTAMASAGAGFIEKWEWEQTEGRLAIPAMDKMPIKELNSYLTKARGIVEWGTGMVVATYGETIDLYAGFEPLATDFSDDLIRSSVLLRLGQVVSELGDIISEKAGLNNQIFSVSDQAAARGLNPGYAKGELVIVDNPSEGMTVDNNKIYVFRRPPSDLKPVAGIATVTEGNMVSHVQLLARNLGIPNAVISIENLRSLKEYEGKEVFYAVSNSGTVIMKTTDRMSDVEKQLFAKRTRNQDRVEVPTDKIDLSQTRMLDMSEIDASASGVVAGPKAANLGELKKLFPDYVVEGLVIPFGIFRQHMNQKMPGQQQSYWEYLNSSFAEAEQQRNNGSSAEAVERFTLGRLSVLRSAIMQIQLNSDFIEELELGFQQTFGNPLGRVPVFLRSDTNMEDLEEFTGAGLNLTKFNVVNRDKIIQGIKEVWASPYTERSFKWRQRYLSNPENVFPSILIIPTVDVEYSGVIITKGITTNDRRDVTIAFSRGAGGAVDGQAAETYLLEHTYDNILLSPARERDFRRLPQNGGSVMNKTSFEEPILNDNNLTTLRQLAYQIHQRFPKSETATTHGPFDIELGFADDKPWLFQVRPFVENDNAKTSEYLESISPKMEGAIAIR